MYADTFQYLLWAGRDSNPRSRKATDLQSARFDRLPTYPLKKVTFVPFTFQHCLSHPCSYTAASENVFWWLAKPNSFLIFEVGEMFPINDLLFGSD